MASPNSDVALCERTNFLRAVHKDFAFLGLNVLPNILAPKGHRGRQKLFQAFHQYYEQDGHKSGSRIVQARYEVNRKYNISTEDIEHFDLSLCYGLLVNTVPAVSWVLYYVYSQPSLLESLRTTISPYIHLLGADLMRHVSIAEVIDGCPLLSSLVQETLRVQSTNASGRVVLQDTMLEDQYLLKKDSILLIPSAELHNNPSIWGPSFKDFDAQRFMPNRTSGLKQPASAYRAYGSGASVCPGRFFAANEIMSILVTMVCKYDMKPVRGRWILPKMHPHITTSILTPVEDIQVTISEREGYDPRHWRFSWRRSDFSPK